MSTPRATAHLDPDAGGVCFLQTWQMSSTEDVDNWLTTMGERIHLLTGLPGFRSMSLHRGLDGTTAAVYAQWDSAQQLHASRDHPLVRKAHEELTQFGRDTGQAYLLQSTYLPDSSPPR